MANTNNAPVKTGLLNIIAKVGEAKTRVLTEEEANAIIAFCNARLEQNAKKSNSKSKATIEADKVLMGKIMAILPEAGSDGLKASQIASLVTEDKMNPISASKVTPLLKAMTGVVGVGDPKVWTKAPTEAEADEVMVDLE